MFELQVQIYLSSNQSDRLQVSETVLVKAENFLELAKILGRFHDLAQELRGAKINR
jgi:hypothetical protein